LEQKDDTLRSVLTPEQFDVYTNAKDELKQALQQDLKHWSPLWLFRIRMATHSIRSQAGRRMLPRSKYFTFF